MWSLRQCIKLSRMQSWWYEEISCSFWRRVRKDRSLNIQEISCRKPVSSKRRHMRSKLDKVSDFCTTDIKISVLKSSFFVYLSSMIIKLKRWSFWSRKQFHGSNNHFYLSRHQIWICLPLRTSSHRTFCLYHIFTSKVIGCFPSFFTICRIKHDLCQTISVSQIYKYNPSMISTITHPSGKYDFFFALTECKLSTGMTSMHNRKILKIKILISPSNSLSLQKRRRATWFCSFFPLSSKERIQDRNCNKKHTKTSFRVSWFCPLSNFLPKEKGRAAKRCHQRLYLIVFCSRRVPNSERFYSNYPYFFLFERRERCHASDR